MLIRRKRETRSSNSSVKSKHNENGHVSNDSKSPKQENVLTKSKRRATALNNLVRFKYEENGYDISDDSEVPQNRKILHRWKRRSYTSYHLIASDHDKNKGNTSDDGKLLNMENVSSRLKRRMKALNSAAVGCNHNETKDVSGDAENPKKENVPSRRKNRMKMCINSDGSKYDQNESHVTDDGKSPEKENVLKRRERGTETYNLIASEYDETDKTVIVSDVGYPSKNESEMTGMSKHHEYYDDVDDNDDIFYTTPKRSLLYKKEKEKTDNSCNENCTSLKSSRNNGHKSVRNSSSQSTLTRNVFRNSLKHSLKSVVWKNENVVDKDNSSDEKSAEIDLLTDSHRQQSSGDIIEKNHSSHKSDDNMHKMKMDSKLMESSRTETRKVSSVGSEHTENEEDMADDDDIFYKTPRRSSLYGKERGRVSSICGNENHTSLKSNKANKNNSSQDLSNRNTNMSRESDTCLFNSVTFRNENRADKDSSSDISSADIEDILTDSNRRQFSGDIMEKIGSCNKSGDIHKIHMESKFMKSSRTETQKDSSTSSEHPENEEKVMEHEDEDDDDDIFCYRTRKQSLPCRKEKK
ncbi:hypothetical protein B7P43_G17069 [Cryptotermes secundus]|nr:hypothetical protein B7P43_G17069 [Cryptotermes secundus]